MPPPTPFKFPYSSKREEGVKEYVTGLLSARAPSLEGAILLGLV